MFECVVVGANDSDGARMAFLRALELTRASGGMLHIVAAHRRTPESGPALPDEFRYTPVGAGATDWLLGQLQAQAAEANVAVTIHPVLADAASAITKVAAREHADLIVLGTTRNRGARHLPSVPKAVMDRAQCAVLVV